VHGANCNQAKTKTLSVVAEYVETQEQRQMLLAFGGLSSGLSDWEATSHRGITGVKKPEAYHPRFFF
jgi:hypothetical protein